MTSHVSMTANKHVLSTLRLFASGHFHHSYFWKRRRNSINKMSFITRETCQDILKLTKSQFDEALYHGNLNNKTRINEIASALKSNGKELIGININDLKRFDSKGFKRKISLLLTSGGADEQALCTSLGKRIDSLGKLTNQMCVFCKMMHLVTCYFR